MLEKVVLHYSSSVRTNSATYGIWSIGRIHLSPLSSCRDGRTTLRTNKLFARIRSALGHEGWFVPPVRLLYARYLPSLVRTRNGARPIPQAAPLGILIRLSSEQRPRLEVQLILDLDAADQCYSCRQARCFWVPPCSAFTVLRCAIRAESAPLKVHREPADLAAVWRMNQTASLATGSRER